MTKDLHSFPRVIIVQDFETVTFYVIFVYKLAFSVTFYVIFVYKLAFSVIFY